MKLAIIGVGDVAQGHYIPFLSVQEDVTLAYHNRTPGKAETAARKFGGTAYARLEELVAWQPDAVFVLTNETTRYETTMQLLTLGVARLFCEKPLVAANGQAHVSEADFERGRELLALAREKGCEVAMMFNYRFFEQTVAAKMLAAERRFGPVTEVAGQVHYACWSHCIDLVHHFAGELVEITALSGTVEREGQGIRANDVAAAFRTSGGAVGTLLGTAAMQWQHPLFELFLTFENGRIHLRDLDGDLEVLDGSRRTHERYSTVRDASRWDHYGASFRKALDAYLGSVRRAEPPPVPGIDGLRELQAEAALRRSIAQKRPVKVQEEFKL